MKVGRVLRSSRKERFRQAFVDDPDIYVIIEEF